MLIIYYRVFIFLESYSYTPDLAKNQKKGLVESLNLYGMCRLAAVSPQSTVLVRSPRAVRSVIACAPQPQSRRRRRASA